MELLLGVAGGLFVGWYFLPQPTFVKTFVAGLLAKFKS